MPETTKTLPTTAAVVETTTTLVSTTTNHPKTTTVETATPLPITETTTTETTSSNIAPSSTTDIATKTSLETTTILSATTIGATTTTLAAKVPSETQVLNVINTLLKSRDSQLNKSVQVLNFTYKNISETSYAIIFTFNLINISIPEDPELKNNTYQHLQNVINNVLNTLLNEPGSQVFEAKFSKFTIGKVVIYIRLIFIARGPVPSEAKILQLATNLLAARLRTKRELRAQSLGSPVSFVNITYTKISDTSYALNFGFEINNVTMSEKLELRDSTYKSIQDSINKLLNEILTEPTATPFVFKDVNFTGNSTTIQADVHYVFSESDIQKPSSFLYALIVVNNETITTTTPAATRTTLYSTVLSTTITNNSTSAAWVVAIIVPCAIAIILIPCWILLCCLLCGCCAALRRRWSRRRSYNVQYTTRNSLF
ncbi:mucin-3A-like [Sinocyclocheilus rhinocerous]|uniref:mucin-3A-like n=1 Tax=Sinocyclocheilus rhinocerous TaxID=307959 RepID=UPI0007B97B13|nr:PREDICTED: mucin-3A-like [Sinocyclocheilus rhinocerous]